ncbi:hypothetical protein SAMN05421753_10361 [Planctomicrobium piriforme]|uniref:Uncharacterized protein n=1 Tax=Planctomicrobium piriforme TaxID=1576369 RepID=A0A1I3D265_9PLAN|nr:hypothetical protein SAMN05421753_10361 [Planctomicrobium piriforme]
MHLARVNTKLAVSLTIIVAVMICFAASLANGRSPAVILGVSQRTNDAVRTSDQHYSAVRQHSQQDGLCLYVCLQQADLEERFTDNLKGTAVAALCIPEQPASQPYAACCSASTNLCSLQVLAQRLNV